MPKYTHIPMQFSTSYRFIRLSLEKISLLSQEDIAWELYREVLEFDSRYSSLDRIEFMIQLLKIQERENLLPKHIAEINPSYLAILACYKCPELIEVFINAGEDIELVDGNKKSPLWNAISNHNFGAIKLLLKYGANPNTPDPNGQPPIHSVIRYMRNSITLTEYNRQQCFECVLMLIEAGANLDAVDPDGKRPIDIAKSDKLTILGSRIIKTIEAFMLCKSLIVENL